MKKGYAISLTAILLLLTISLSLSASYGLWKITSNEEALAVDTSGCFEVLYSDGKGVIKQNFIPMSNAEGKGTSPYTFAIENTCDTEKTVEIRLNLLTESTLETRGLTIYMAGDIELEPTLYGELKNSRSTMDAVSSSKIIGTISVPAKGTVRSNLKLWIDEKIVSGLNQNQVLQAIVEVTDKESIVLPTFKETILEQNGGLDLIKSKAVPDFSNVATTAEGLYQTIDEDGTSYYFRGAAQNNYVEFAGMVWRIVRINGDETIRLILQDSIPDVEYNTTRNDLIYAGYTYIKNEVTENSNMKSVLETWYQENIVNQNSDQYVAFSRFCNDTNNYLEAYHYYYSPTRRLIDAREPVLTCDSMEEQYGGMYRYKIGLLTADEASLAGVVLNQENQSIYLNNGTDFYTMTPSDFSNYSVYMLTIKASGALGDTAINQKKGLRPVLSLKASTVVTGDGTKENPYKIDQDAN